MGVSRLMGPILVGVSLIGGVTYGVMLEQTFQKEQKKNEILSRETHFPENQAVLKKTLPVDKYDSLSKTIDKACMTDKKCFYKSWEQFANAIGGITNPDSLKQAYYVMINKIGVGLIKAK